MTHNGIWIGQSNDKFEEGQVGFLVHLTHHTRGYDYWQLRPRPATTERSFLPMLEGVVSDNAYTRVQAEGMARVVKVAPNGRALIEVLMGADLSEALERFGFPELAEG